jgi:RNA polymerase sigma-70 factor (ECF subfamily)
MQWVQLVALTLSLRKARDAEDIQALDVWRGAIKRVRAAHREEQVDDDTLTRALAADLDGAFEALVRVYQDRLYAFGLRLTGSPRDAEEIAQDAFVRAYRALARYPAERVETLKLRAWLFQVTVNVARNRARTKRPAEVPLLAADDGHDSPAARIADDAELPEQVAERHDEQDRMAAVVATLPERYRAAVVLRHIQGLSYQEIAAVLGQPAGTVKSNVHRGVAYLRAALDAAGVRFDSTESAADLAAGGVG